LAPLSPHPPSHSVVMNHQADGHQAYPSSSQDVYPLHRPDPSHNQAMFGASQRLAASSARRIYAPGSYVSCGTGIFAGLTIRAEVTEVQKANVGRKYAASKDRRALDPPPVTELRIYDIHDAGDGTTQETELDYRGLQPNGLICHVEVFQLHMTTEENPAQMTDFPVMSPPAYPRAAPNVPTVEAYWRTQPITSASNHTSSLVGDLFTQALNLPIGQNGKNSLLFVFADLSVQREGWFLFRYRVFDLFSVTEGSQPILAECWGRPFRIYATKQFPGLEPSTELTKQLHSHHVPVRAREVRRKRKKNSNNDSSADSDQDQSTTP
jgi:hypothetical protein